MKSREGRNVTNGKRVCVSSEGQRGQVGWDEEGRGKREEHSRCTTCKEKQLSGEKAARGRKNKTHGSITKGLKGGGTGGERASLPQRHVIVLKLE